MNYYHLSYDLIDVESNDNDEALKALLSLIQTQLCGDVLNRPVRSTLVFSSMVEFEDVRNAFFAWSQNAKAYYVVSQISTNVNEDVCCRLVANKDLESNISKLKDALRHKL